MRVEFVVGARFASWAFLRVFWFSSLHKKQHLQIPIRPGYRTSMKPAKANVASSVNIVNFIISLFVYLFTFF